MVYILLAVLMIVVDQVTKYYVVTHFALGESVPVLDGIFHWTFILNPGALLFGMLEGSRWLFVLIAVIVVAVMWFLRKEIDALGLWARIGAPLFAGGAIGNLIDRARQGFSNRLF